MPWKERSRNRTGLCAAAALALLPALSHAADPAPEPNPDGVLVVTASARDYVFGAGGLIRGFVAEGKPVYVVHFGNGEKGGLGPKPAETRLASRQEAERAAKALGVTETLFLGHKSGELAALSSSEMRNQLITLVRFYKPRVLVFPDWYIHYLGDDDIYRVGRMAEESPYGGGDYFLQEMTYIGWRGYSAREYYFYSPYRPYRAREGGEGKARMKAVDISGAFERKLDAALQLETANETYGAAVKKRLQAAGRPTDLLAELTRSSVDKLVHAYLHELAETVGAKYDLSLAEEFNYLGVSQGVREHIREKAKPLAARGGSQQE